MDSPPEVYLAPAGPRGRIPITDDHPSLANAATDHFTAHTPRDQSNLSSHLTAGRSHIISPPQDHIHRGDNKPTLPAPWTTFHPPNGQISPYGQLDHQYPIHHRPPTLPQDEYSPLRQWYAQEHHEPKEQRGRSETSRTVLPLSNFAVSQPSDYSHYQAPPIASASNSFQNKRSFPSAAPAFEQHTSNSSENHPRLPSVRSLLHPGLAPSSYVPVLKPLKTNTPTLSSTHLTNQPAPMPAIQQWPTNNLPNTRNAHSFVGHDPVVPLVTETQTYDVSPGQLDKRVPDKKTLRKQERFRQKGEERRRSKTERSTHAPQPTPCRKPRTRNQIPPTTAIRAEGEGRKRKNVSLMDVAGPTTPPNLRHSFIPYHPLIEPRYADYGWTAAVPSTVHQTYPHSAPQVSVPATSEYSAHAIPVARTDWDTLPQAIATKYEDYKWSIKLFELQEQSGYDFAQSYIDDLITANLGSNLQYKWQSHTTRGFIRDGGRMSFIVLHNAVNPFTRGLPPDATTTIGVYGYFWHKHNEIHWMTVTPNIRGILQFLEANGAIQVKRKWDVDMERAADRRFHRAYWLAANALDLRNLLNHSEPDGVPHDAVEEDEDDGFELSEADLSNEWDVSWEESRQAWEEVLRVVAGVGGDEMPEHVVTGCSEWE